MYFHNTNNYNNNNSALRSNSNSRINSDGYSNTISSGSSHHGWPISRTASTRQLVNIEAIFLSIFLSLILTSDKTIFLLFQTHICLRLNQVRVRVFLIGVICKYFKYNNMLPVEVAADDQRRYEQEHPDADHRNEIDSNWNTEQNNSVLLAFIV